MVTRRAQVGDCRLASQTMGMTRAQGGWEDKRVDKQFSVVAMLVLM